MNPEDIQKFRNYLVEILIPDLRESGNDATADDFENAVLAIDALTQKILDLVLSS